MAQRPTNKPKAPPMLAKAKPLGSPVATRVKGHKTAMSSKPLAKTKLEGKTTAPKTATPKTIGAASKVPPANQTVLGGAGAGKRKFPAKKMDSDDRRARASSKIQGGGY